MLDSIEMFQYNCIHMVDHREKISFFLILQTKRVASCNHVWFKIMLQEFWTNMEIFRAWLGFRIVNNLNISMD
jgi:hypothetical protein